MDSATRRSDVASSGRGSLTPLHLVVVLLCAVGFGLDLSEFAVGNVLSTIFSDGPSRLPPVELALLLGAVYAGAAVGTPIFGSIGDRRGLRWTMVLMLGWIGVATLAAAASVTPVQLTIARFVTGMALGGFPPVMIAFVADVAPAGQRGRLIFWTCALAYLGPPLMVFGIRWLTLLSPTGDDGWRLALMTAGVLSVAAAVGLRRIPEAPRWLLANGRAEEAAMARRRYAAFAMDEDAVSTEQSGSRSAGPTAERADAWRHNRRPVILYAGGYVTIAIATIAFPLVTGPVLLARGMGLNDALLFVALGTAGPVAGTLLASLFIDRVSRHVVLMTSAAVMLLAVITFFGVGGRAPLMLSVCAFGIGMAIYLPAAAALGTEMFPMRIRAAATSIGWAHNRLTAAFVPLVILPLVHARLDWAVALVLCAGLVATLAVLQCLDANRRSRQGRSEALATIPVDTRPRS